MKHLRERGILAGLLLMGPLVYYLTYMGPALGRIADLRAQRQGLEGEVAGPLVYAGLSAEERQFLGDGVAPWRRRMPTIDGDPGKLNHYHQVVNDLQRTWHEAGVQVLGIRSSWDMLRGSYSMPGPFPRVEPTLSPAPSGKVRGWVLEARVDAPTERLFQALWALERTQPLLEPVGLRWEFDPHRGRFQYLTLRNLVLER